MTQKLLSCQAPSQVIGEPTSVHVLVLYRLETLRCTATFTTGSAQSKGRTHNHPYSTLVSKIEECLYEYSFRKPIYKMRIPIYIM